MKDFHRFVRRCVKSEVPRDPGELLEGFHGRAGSQAPSLPGARGARPGAKRKGGLRGVCSPGELPLLWSRETTWEACGIFACGLVGNPTYLLKFDLLLPFQRQPRKENQPKDKQPACQPTHQARTRLSQRETLRLEQKQMYTEVTCAAGTTRNHI